MALKEKRGETSIKPSDLELIGSNSQKPPTQPKEPTPPPTPANPNQKETEFFEYSDHL